MKPFNDTAHHTDALAALRTATASRHERLDSGLPLSAPAPSLDDYASHLRMVRDWLAPLETWLNGFGDGPQAEPSLPFVDWLALIQADLAEPGMPEVRPMRPAPGWPLDASAAYRWGVAYVIEGSQLGGAVLHKQLHARLAPHPLRYLRGADAGPGPRWRDFMGALRSHVQSPEQIADACAGACAAFDAILALAPLQE
ncbi:biliverdin-producing heme oxygenase [Massilia sp. G4R7]|uniref:Biliverdin-producing heme oxygenase n=1 Tax=Massilia phyllostachyos TaxID=2898585 RepID=A0ABS8Q1V3_9BURK|nr:biliverdin-producing heme oxygenase [Massilia phyllostachyos]MCD2515700.1 biliverdin-producing heme oxygenase [Massilia phyllostachyos]